MDLPRVADRRNMANTLVVPDERTAAQKRTQQLALERLAKEGIAGSNLSVTQPDRELKIKVHNLTNPTKRYSGSSGRADVESFDDYFVGTPLEGVMRMLEVQLHNGDIPKYWDSEDYFQKLAEGDAVRLSADREGAEADPAAVQYTTMSSPLNKPPAEGGGGDGDDDTVDEGYAEAGAAGAPAIEQQATTAQQTATAAAASSSRGPPPSLRRFKPLPPILPKVATTVVTSPDTVSLVHESPHVISVRTRIADPVIITQLAV